MKKLLMSLVCVSLGAFSLAANAADPIKALLITGGCCHDYTAQAALLQKGIAAYANITFDVVNEGKGTEHVHAPFKKKNWSKGYDIIIHNQCSAKLGDVVGNAVAKEHFDTGVAGVAIHCAFHTFRNMESNEWRKCLGATSKRHGAKVPVTVSYDLPDHPIVKGVPEFTTENEELYVIEKVWDTATILATGAQGETRFPLMFAVEYGKAKLFTVTLGHMTHTFTIKEWMEIVARGVLWSTDHIEADGSASKGYGPGGK